MTLNNEQKMEKTNITIRPVKVNPLYIKRKKLEVVADIEGWENAGADSEDEREWEQRLRYDLSRLTEWEKKWGGYETIQELKFWLKEELRKGEK